MPSKRLPAKATYGSLLPDNEPGEELEGARLLPLAQIHPNNHQFRQTFNEETIRELADSIAEQGLIEPLIVRKLDDGFEIIAGERRWRALLLLGTMPLVPCLIRELSDVEALLITATENLQREDLDPEDEARQFQSLVEVTGLSQRALAEKLGKDHNYISRRIRLLANPEALRLVREGVPMRKALEMTGVETVSPGHTELPEVVERATADKQGTRVAGYTRGGPIPYRDRPLTQMIDFSERVDWRSVPKESRHEVLTRLTMLEEHIARAKQAIVQAENDAADVSA